MSEAHPPAGERPEEGRPAWRPLDRFWPYADLEEEPTEAELAALDPDLRAALFRGEPQPFSITLSFPRFEGPDYERALALARGAAEYRAVGSGRKLRHRARYFPARCREAAGTCSRLSDAMTSARCSIDDRPVPYARELWLPLVWFLIPRPVSRLPAAGDRPPAPCTGRVAGWFAASSREESPAAGLTRAW